MNPSFNIPPPAVANDRQASFVPLVSIGSATLTDRESVYRLRHDIYASELGQHAVNQSGRLTDALDRHNAYLVARCGGDIAGFVSITPPSSPKFSIDKYFDRQDLPWPISETTFEVRLLTVVKPRRRSDLAGLLMYAALRWVEAHGGERIVGIGRQEVMDLYRRCGLKGTGQTTDCGSVRYELMHATVDELGNQCRRHSGLLMRLVERTDWLLPFPFHKPARCFHGGAFFHAIGERFDDLSRHHQIINADVLDAWFPPAPGVIQSIKEELPWLLRTSPPTDCNGLIETIAEARGVRPMNVLPGAGSSDLIFRAMRHWLTPQSHVLILDPTYGEYAHVLERVIGCMVDRLALSPNDGLQLDEDRLRAAFHDQYDLIVLVNPNSPTGRHVPRERMESLLNEVPQRTRVWIDEAYVEYAGPGQSLEAFATQSENVVVCKSMSKVYALSGARVAYLCAGAHQLEALRAVTPPWVVGLPSQVAAVRALSDPQYYAMRHRETAELRELLADELRNLGWNVLPGIANFLLCEVPAEGPTAAEFVKACRDYGLFLRDAALMGSQLGNRFIRLAVKDAQSNGQMIQILERVRTKPCDKALPITPVP